MKLLGQHASPSSLVLTVCIPALREARSCQEPHQDTPILLKINQTTIHAKQRQQNWEVAERGLTSFSPSPMTTTPSICTVASTLRIMSTAAWSAAFLSPCRGVPISQVSYMHRPAITGMPGTLDACREM